MNKYKEKIGNILNKVKGNKRILYLTFCTVLILSCLVLNVTFAKYTDKTNKQEANIIIGDLKYNMVINEVTTNESVGTKLPSNTIIGDRIILLKAGKTEQFNMIFSSLNEIDTKYEIIYRVCTDVNCTSFIDTPNTIQIAYHIDTPDVSGTISAGKMKSIILVSDNQDDNDYYVQIDLNVGYAHNELALTNQISNKFEPGSLEGNLSIIAYVDGVEVETFPTEPNYETGITCLYKNGNTSTARGVFKYIAGKGWVVDVFDLDKSLTTCRVDFTKVLKVTYEILSKRYSCANLDQAEKSNDPIISYSGNCTLVSDTTNSDGTHTWRMMLLSNGTLSVDGLIYIDAFLVGGGGGGGGGRIHNGLRYSGGGGGGGYTKTLNDVRLDNKTSSYSIVIGAGGAGGGYSSNGSAGGTTSAFGGSVSGGAGGNGGGDNPRGGNGGSGGGQGNLKGVQYIGDACNTGAKYGNSSSGTGQGTTTCEFGEGTLSGCTKGDNFAYSTAGCNAPAVANSGNGGQGGKTDGSNGYAGYSGIVVIRDVRS